jgi:hypothetical protein
MVKKQKVYKCSNFKNCGETAHERESNFYQCLDCEKWSCYNCSHWGDDDSPICIKCRFCNGCNKDALKAKCERIERCESCLEKWCSDCWGETENGYSYCGGCYDEDKEKLEKKEVEFKEKVNGLVNLMEDTTIDNEFWSLDWFRDLKNSLEKANKEI